MKQIKLFIIVFTVLTANMYSEVQNTDLFQVIQLNEFGSVLNIFDDGGNPGYDPGRFVIPIDSKTQYEIHRVDLIVTSFVNSTDGDAAFPKWEQFQLGLKLSAFLAHADASGGIARYKDLFNNLMYTTSDGISSTRILYEPFWFQTDSGPNNVLVIDFENLNSIFVTLGIPVPPVAPNVNIFINGLLTLEGVSYTTDVADKHVNGMKQKY